MVGECTTSTTTANSPASASNSPSTGGAGGGAAGYYSYGGTPAAPPSAGVTPAASAATTSGGSAGAPLAASSQSGPCSGVTPPVGAPSGAWHCSFDDEFNGSSLDTSKWSPMLTAGSAYKTGPAFNRACYVDSPQTISESGGYLDLSVISSGGRPYSCQGTMSTSQSNELAGMVVSYQKFSQEYGFFETRASMPPVNFPGLQETLWLYPENETLYGPWPDSGEIDYAEFYSEYPNNDYPAIHYPGSSSDPNAESNNCVISGQSPAGQFHTYALLWTPTTLTSYYDGVACLTDTYAPHVNSPDTAPEPFNQPFFLALTSALGSANGDQFKPGQTPLPATMQVDWVRVWQYG
jgi:beta-glucanase (GH16 family)